MNFDWPVDRWTPKVASFEVFSANLDSPSSLTGSQRSVSLDALWRASLTIPIQTIAEAIELQAFLDDLKGSANTVTIYDPQRIAPRALVTTSETFSDATLFSDGTGFTGPAFSVYVSAAASRGASQISLAGMTGTTKFISRGDLLEIGDGQNGSDLYQAQQDLTPTSGAGSLRINPPLRQGLAIGDSVRLTRPRLRARRADTVAAVRGINWSSELTLSFVEDKR